MNARPTLDVVSAAERIGDGVYVLDVRQPEEFAAGHVERAVLVPLGELPARLGEVPADRQVVVVCRSGNRSGQATDYLVRAGVDAWNMEGGMLAWAAADLPIAAP